MCKLVVTLNNCLSWISFGVRCGCWSPNLGKYSKNGHNTQLITLNPVNIQSPPATSICQMLVRCYCRMIEIGPSFVVVVCCGFCYDNKHIFCFLVRCRVVVFQWLFLVYLLVNGSESNLCWYFIISATFWLVCARVYAVYSSQKVGGGLECECGCIHCSTILKNLIRKQIFVCLSLRLGFVVIWVFGKG